MNTRKEDLLEWIKKTVIVPKFYEVWIVYIISVKCDFYLILVANHDPDGKS